MDETDVLQRVKNSFHLGNYKNAFEVWREAAASGVSLSHKVEEQLGTIVQRLVVIYLRHNEKFIMENQACFARFKKSINLFIEYLSPIELGADKEECKGLFETFVKARAELKGSADKLTLDTIHNFLAVAAGEFGKLLEVEPQYKAAHLEFLLLKVNAFVACFQPEDAHKVLKSMRSLDSEDVTTNLAELTLHIHEKKFEEGIKLIQEMRDKFEDSSKLLNLAAVCFMGSREFEKADLTLKKLESFYESNKEQQFVAEYSLCLRNLYIISAILGKPQEVKNSLLERLSTLTKESDPLLDKMLRIEAFFKGEEAS